LRIKKKLPHEGFHMGAVQLDPGFEDLDEATNRLSFTKPTSVDPFTGTSGTGQLTPPEQMPRPASQESIGSIRSNLTEPVGTRAATETSQPAPDSAPAAPDSDLYIVSGTTNTVARPEATHDMTEDAISPVEPPEASADPDESDAAGARTQGAITGHPPEALEGVDMEEAAGVEVSRTVERRLRVPRRTRTFDSGVVVYDQSGNVLFDPLRDDLVSEDEPRLFPESVIDSRLDWAFC
jgi:hypothetical protein